MSYRHLLSQHADGIQIQIYCALIAFLLIQLASGQEVKPNQWTYKLLCLYFQGLADESEVLAHLQERANPQKKTRLKNSAPPSPPLLAALYAARNPIASLHPPTLTSLFLSLPLSPPLSPRLLNPHTIPVPNRIGTSQQRHPLEFQGFETTSNIFLQGIKATWLAWLVFSWRGIDWDWQVLFRF